MSASSLFDPWFAGLLPSLWLQFELAANALCGDGNDSAEFPVRVARRIAVRPPALGPRARAAHTGDGNTWVVDVSPAA